MISSFDIKVLIDIDALAEDELVARIIDIPELWLARALAIDMVNDVEELAAKGGEEHAVAGIVGEEWLWLLYPRTCDGA